MRDCLTITQAVIVRRWVMAAVQEGDEKMQVKGSAKAERLRKQRTEGRKAKVEMGLFLCWQVACLTSQQHAGVSQGPIYSDNCTCCHTEIEVADQTFYLTQSQYTDTGPTSPSADPITPGVWQGSHWSAIVAKRNWNSVASGFQTPDLPLSGRTP